MIQFRPIGSVRNGIIDSHGDTPWSEIESEIILEDAWREALDGLDQFSHIWVIFHLSHMGAEIQPRVHPMRADWLPLVGLFATRTPNRPNPIGVTAVQLLSVNGTTLRVRGLDAFDGTPVLDIKPYLARGDAKANTRAAEWVAQYWATLPPESP